MRVASSVAAAARHSRRLPLALAAAALAACAHGGATVGMPVARMTTGGEVERTLVAAAAAPGESTFRPIALDELVTAAAPSRTRVVAAANSDGARAEVWRGTYRGHTYGQRGALALVLRPSADGQLRGIVAWRVARPATLGRFGPGAGVELVRVPVVSAARDGEQLVLRLDEYFDPACNCTARATFRGALRGDTLSGRFAVDAAATVVGEDRGRWRAVRAAP